MCGFYIKDLGDKILVSLGTKDNPPWESWGMITHSKYAFLHVHIQIFYTQAEVFLGRNYVSHIHMLTKWIFYQILCIIKKSLSQLADLTHLFLMTA